jgi:hypothetical protein
MRLAVALIACCGCHVWIPIKPTEVPKLTGGDRTVEQPDGTRFRFAGSADLRVTTHNGTTTYWEPQARREGDRLLVVSASHPPASISLSEITVAEASQLDPVNTTAAVLLALAAGFLVVMFVAHMEFPGP